MKIEILGAGCSRCEKLFRKVNKVIKENYIEAEVIKIDDIKETMRYGIMMTPGLVINKKLKTSVNVPSEKEILKFIKEEI
jgi:small redox-active disulfide protein 2